MSVLSNRSMEMWQSGLSRKWKRNFEPPRVEVCLAKGVGRIEGKSIRLVDLTSAFLVLGIGSLISLFSFFCELVSSGRPK